jgi:hypothetical protein
MVRVYVSVAGRVYGPFWPFAPMLKTCPEEP